MKFLDLNWAKQQEDRRDLIELLKELYRVTYVSDLSRNGVLKKNRLGT